MPTGPRPRGSSCSAASAAGVASFPRTSTAVTAAAAGAKQGHPQEKHVSKRCTPLAPPAGRSNRGAVANAAAQGVSNLAARAPSLRQTAAAGGAHADVTEPAGRPRSNREGGSTIETETEQPAPTLERRTVSGTANPPKIHQSLSKSARWDFLPRLRKANSNTTRTSTTKSSREKTASPNSASTPSNAVENFPAHGALPSEVSYPVKASPTATGTPSSSNTSSTVLPRSSHISSKLFGTPPHTAPAADLLPRRGRGPSTEKQHPVVTSSSRPHLSSPASPAAGAAACRQTVDRASSCSRVPGQEGQSDDIFNAAPASMPAPPAKSQFPAFAGAAAAASAGGCVGNSAATVALPASSVEGLLAGATCNLSRAPASTQESLGPPSGSVTISDNQAPSQLANCGSPSAAACSSSQPQGRRPQRPAAPAPAAAAPCTSLFLLDSDVAAGSQTPACGTRRLPAPSSGAAASCAVPPAVTAAAVPPPPIIAARGAPTSPSCVFLDDRTAASSAADPIAALPAAAAALSAAPPARPFADVRHARLSNGSACLTHLRWWLRRRLRLASSGLLHKNVMNHPHVLAAARIAPLQTAAAAGKEALEAAPATTAGSASARAAQREGGGPSCAAISSAVEAAAALAAGCSSAFAAAAATTSAAGATGAAASSGFTPHSVEAVAVQLAHKLICCLLLKEKSSVLLLGPPGSGKTAAVSLALRTVQQLAQQQRNQRAQQHRDAKQVPKEHPEQHEAHTHETSPWTGQLQQQQGGGELSAPARPDEGVRENAAPCGRAAPSSGAGGAEVAAATAAGPSSSVNRLLCAGGPRGAACAVFTEAFPASPLRCSRPLISAAVAAVGAAEPSGAVCEVVAGCASSAGAAGALSAADSKPTPRSGKKAGVRSAGAVGRKGVVGRGGTGGGRGERNERILTATQQQQLLPDLLVVHVCCSLYPDETAMLHTIVQQLAQALHCQQLPPASASFEELCNTLRLILGDSCSVFHRAVVIVLDHFEVCCFAAEAAGAAAGGGRCWGAGAAWNGMQVPTPQVQGTGHSTRRQQLLYCLFDLQHSSKLQLCTVCVSSVLDITEVMEKRIRSRFSLQTLYVSGSGAASPLLQFVRQQLLHLSPQQLLRIATDAAAAEQVYVDWLDHAAAPAAGLAAAAEGRMEQHEKLAEGGGRAGEEEEGRRGEMMDSDTAAESDEEQGRVAGREEQQQHSKEGKEIGTQQKKPRRDRAQLQEEKKNRRSDTEAEAARDTETAGEKGKPPLLPVLGGTAEAETEAGEDGEERSRVAKRREKEAAAGDPVERGCMAKAAGAANGQTVRTTAADVVKAAAGGAARREPVGAAVAAKDAETGAANAAAGEDTEAAASETTAETTAVADAEAVAAEMAEREAARGKRRSTANGGTPVKKRRHCTGDCCEAPSRRAGAVEQPHQLAAGSAAASRKPGSTLPCISAAVDATVKPHASRCPCLTVDRVRNKSSSRWQPSAEDRQTAEVFVAAYLAAVNEELACCIFRTRFLRHFDMGRQPRFFFAQLVDHLLSIADGQSYMTLPGSAAVVAAAAAVPPPPFPPRSCLAVAAGGHAGTAADSGAAGDAAPPTTVTMAAGRGGSVAAAAAHDCDLAFPLSGCRKLTHSAAVIAAAAAAPALSPSLTPSRSSSSSVASPRPPAAAAAAPLQRPLLQPTQHREATSQHEPQTQQGEQQQQQQKKDKGEEERQGEAEPDGTGLPKTPTKQCKCRSSVASWFSPTTVRSPLAAATAAEDSPLSHSLPVQLRSPALAAERHAASAGNGRRSSSSGAAAATDQAAGTHAETQLQALCGGCLLREEPGIETLLPHLSLPEHLILGAFTRLHEQRRLPKTLHLACEQLAQLFVNPHAKQQQPHIAGLRRAFTRLLERGVLRLCDVAAIHQTAAFAGVAAAAADGLFSSSFLCYVPCKFPAYSKYRQMLETLRLPGEFKAWVCSFEFCS